MIPIHNRDSKADPSKYQSISLLSIMSKIMETIVQHQLQKYLQENKLISTRQFGFRSCHITGDLLSVLSQRWTNCLDRNKENCAIALDIRGAFDKVWHKGLLAKLGTKAVCSTLLTWLQSYLSDRSTKVVLSGQSSDPKPINASVPKGSILGPLLFTVFINDLVDECERERDLPLRR